jgi:hypothetical protein
LSAAEYGVLEMVYHFGHLGIELSTANYKPALITSGTFFFKAEILAHYKRNFRM